MYTNPSLFNKYSAWLLSAIELQLFITCVSMPILVHWGLPLSLMTVPGNLLFAPILTLFLLLSSIIFFAELLHIPNGLSIKFLEYLSFGWEWVMSHGSNSWLFGMPQFPVWITAMLCTAPFIIICLRGLTQRTRIALLALVISGSYGLSHGYLFFQHHAFTLAITPKTEWRVMRHSNQTIIVDSMPHHTLKDPESIASYGIIQPLLKQCGDSSIDYLIITHPDMHTFKIIRALAEKTRIGHLYIVYFKGTMSKAAWYHFFTCIRAVQESGGSYHRIYQHPITIHLDNHRDFLIKPTAERVERKEIDYPVIETSIIPLN